jgi:dienelactone hydrolase
VRHAGISPRGECALLLGTIYRELIHAVVSYVGSSVVGPSPGTIDPAWTLAGKPVPYVTGPDLGDPEPSHNPEAIIRVETIAGPIFLVSGLLDGLWPSYGYARAIVRRLRAHGRSDYTSLAYTRASHAVGTAVPNFPIAEAFTVQGRVLDLGGTPEGDARARADSWPRLLAFLSHLRP